MKRRDLELERALCRSVRRKDASRDEAALEQRLRLEAEGIRFRGSRVSPEHILSSEDLVCLRL